MNCEDGKYKYVLARRHTGEICTWKKIRPVRFFSIGTVSDGESIYTNWKLIEDEAPSDKNDDVIAMPQGSIPPLVEEWESVDPRA